jgi:hypothetical protein
MYRVLNSNITGKSSVHAGLLLVVQTRKNQMELGPDYMGVWKKFRFELPHCFSSGCRKIRTRVIVEQKIPLWMQTSALNHQLQYFRRFNAFRPQEKDHKWQFYNSDAIFMVVKKHNTN